MILTNVGDTELFSPLDGLDIGHPRADEAHPVFFLRVIIISLKILTVGAHVHEENGTLQIVACVFLCDDCLLNGIHTTDRRTVPMIALMKIP